MFNTGFPPEWSTLKKLVWLVGSGIVGAAAGVWKTVSGSLIHITDALASPMQKCEVTLEPIQDLHGQDAPYPAGGGRNKIFFVEYSTDDYIPFSAILQPVIDVVNQTITLQCAASGQTVLLYKHNFPAGQYTATYTISKYNKRVIVRCFDANNVVLTNEDISVEGGSWNSFYNGWYLTGVTFTIPDGADHFWIGFGANGDERDNEVVLSNIQLEPGSTATPYSPYSNICPITGWTGCEVWVKDEYDTSLPATASVTFPDSVGTVYGGTVDLASGELVVDWASRLLNGSDGSTYTNNGHIDTTTKAFVRIPDKAYGFNNIISDLFHKGGDDVFGKMIGRAVNNGVEFCLPPEVENNAQAVIGWFAANPVQLVYELAEPITIQLTPQQISTLKGENNVWSNGDSVEITYKAQA